MRTGKVISGFIAMFLSCSVSAFAANITLNKNVTLEGTFFTNGWGGGWGAQPSSVVDGVFLPKSNRWDQGPVWWDAHGHVNVDQFVEVDLGGTYLISAFTVQVDDNDAYKLEYWDSGIGSWKTAWDIPNYNFYNNINLWGMQTRPNPYLNSQQYVLADAIQTDQLRLSGNHGSGDRLFSVSEIQAFGTAAPAPVPEPGTMILLGSGLATLAGYGRKRFRKK